MILNATTEAGAQVVGSWTAGSESQYQKIELAAWISQNKTARTTTVYFKWRRNQYNYYPYWEDSHDYTVQFGGSSLQWAFNIPQIQSNGITDFTTAQAIVVAHDSQTGQYSGSLSASGYICWEAFSESGISIELPTINADPEPTPVEPDPPAPLVFDDNPRYYIYADGQLVYAAGLEGYDVLDPKLTMEVNKAGSLSFDIPVGSKMYNALNKMQTTIEARQGNEILFRGRVLNTKRNTMNTISYYCEGMLSWLVDIVLTPYQRQNFQARDLLKLYLQWYNSRADANRKIEYKYSDISAKISIDSKEHSNVWSQIKKTLIDGVGGYIVPYLTPSETGIQWLSTYGKTTTQVIQFGENLLDFSEYIDASEVFTAVRPYGKETDGVRISLPEEFLVNNDAVSVFGRIERTVFFDEATTVDLLRQSATNYLRNGVQIATTINIKAVDLHLLNENIDRIRLGDSVRVVSVPHAVDAYFMCTKITHDFAHPKNTVYTFGSTQRTISELADSSYKQYAITTGGEL